MRKGGPIKKQKKYHYDSDSEEEIEEIYTLDDYIQTISGNYYNGDQHVQIIQTLFTEIAKREEQLSPKDVDRLITHVVDYTRYLYEAKNVNDFFNCIIQNCELTSKHIDQLLKNVEYIQSLEWMITLINKGYELTDKQRTILLKYNYKIPNLNLDTNDVETIERDLMTLCSSSQFVENIKEFKKFLTKYKPKIEEKHFLTINEKVNFNRYDIINIMVKILKLLIKHGLEATVPIINIIGSYHGKSINFSDINIKQWIEDMFKMKRITNLSQISIRDKSYRWGIIMINKSLLALLIDLSIKYNLEPYDKLYHQLSFYNDEYHIDGDSESESENESGSESGSESEDDSEDDSESDSDNDSKSDLNDDSEDDESDDNDNNDDDDEVLDDEIDESIKKTNNKKNKNHYKGTMNDIYNLLENSGKYPYTNDIFLTCCNHLDRNLFHRIIKKNINLDVNTALNVTINYNEECAKKIAHAKYIITELLNMKALPTIETIKLIKNQNTLDLLLKYGLVNINKDIIKIIAQKSLIIGDLENFNIDYDLDIYRYYHNAPEFPEKYINKFKKNKDLHFDLRTLIRSHKTKTSEEQIIERIENINYADDMMYDDAYASAKYIVATYLENVWGCKPNLNTCLKINDKTQRLLYYQRIADEAEKTNQSIRMTTNAIVRIINVDKNVNTNDNVNNNANDNQNKIDKSQKVIVRGRKKKVETNNA